jgi:diguanylate cyclase (GGDEF)-like protein
MPTNQSNEKIHQLIQSQINLPSPPAIAAQILNTVQNEDSSLADLKKIISADPALTGKMLHIANSTFYSLPNKVTNITRAMSILGTNVIKNIALSFVIAEDLKGQQTSYFDFDLFWRRSVTTAVAAELIKNLTAISNDDIFVTALLQNLGILILALNKKQEYFHLLETCQMGDDAACLIKAEQEKYQFDHQQLGHTLTHSWELPQSISEPIRYHREPEKAPKGIRQTARILFIANLLSTIYHGTETTETVLLLQNKMKEYFDLDTQQTQNLLDDVAQQSIDIQKTFDLDPGQMKPYSQMLQEANEELGRLNFSYEQLVMALKESKEKSEKFANELQAANKQLEGLAFRDGLTNLYNHRYFQEILEKEMARAHRYKKDLCLIIFDIDFFKKVNDNYGHPAGDQVLISLAEKLNTVIRPSDIIARYGGEEFMVILPETNESGMMILAERLRCSVMEITTEVNGLKISVTISSGGVHFSPDREGVTKQDLIDTADRALYMSKKNGRNRFTLLPITPNPDK